jgi:hypothetical protein
LIQNQVGAQGSLCGIYSTERRSSSNSGLDGGGGGQSGFTVTSDVPCNGTLVRPKEFIVTGGTRWSPTGYMGPEKCPDGLAYTIISSSYGERTNSDNIGVTTVVTESASCVRR